MCFDNGPGQDGSGSYELCHLHWGRCGAGQGGFTQQRLAVTPAFATLVSNVERLAQVAHAAGALVDRIANLLVGHTLAKAYIHGIDPIEKHYAGMLMLTRMIVKRVSCCFCQASLPPFEHHDR